MAEITTTRSLPAEYIEALGKTYAQDLTSAVGGLKGLDVSKAIQYYAPTVMTRALTVPGGG